MRFAYLGLHLEKTIARQNNGYAYGCTQNYGTKLIILLLKGGVQMQLIIRYKSKSLIVTFACLFNK